VLQRLQQAYNDLHGGASAGTTSTGESTEFAVLKATAQVNRGVLRNEDLAAQSPVLRITGKGEIDLVRQRIDYLLSPMIVNPQALRGSSWLDQLQNRPLPIRIRGDLKAPQVQLDLAEALKGRLGDQGQKSWSSAWRRRCRWTIRARAPAPRSATAVQPEGVE